MKQRKPGTVYVVGQGAHQGRVKAHTVGVGDVIAGHYVVDEILDEGGMAVVYRATNSATGKVIALKILQAQLGDRPEFMQLFAKEAKVCSVIGDNEHIVQVYDAGLDEERGLPFIVMELLDGETLERVLERGPLEPTLVRSLLEQLRSALDQAHRAGVVHRDLKPSNLFLSLGKDGAPLLKVMDFGIAKVLEGEAVRTATHIGTPAYNAPEQMGATTRKLAAKQGITIASGVSPATDVWALGLLVYEMFTGDLPGQYWGVETLSELPMKVAFDDHAPASARAGRNAPLLPGGFDGWFSRCLHKDASKRYQSAGEAIDALFALIENDDVHDVTESELEQAATRVVYEAPVSERPPVDRSAASEPPPLPRISSPAITVAGAAEEARKKKEASSSVGPLVRSEKTSGARGRGASLAFAVGTGAAVLAAAFIVGLGVQSKDAVVTTECDPSDPDIAVCTTTCDEGDVVSCGIVANAYRTGGRVERDLDAARRFDIKACGIADLAVDADGPARRAWAKDVESGGCPEGRCFADACVRAADHFDATGDDADALTAAAIYKRVCAYGLDDETDRGVEGCVGLGAQRERAGELVAARNYYLAACEGDVSDGCVALGAALERGDSRGEGRDEKRARALYQKACDGGDLKGCTRLGYMVERGKGGWEADQTAAVALYKRACDGGQQLGCVHLAEAHRRGKGGLTRDAVRAAELLTASCDGGEMAACAELAWMVDNGQGGLDRDEKRSYQLNKRACEGNALAGCSQLGEMYLRGAAGLTKDVDEGRKLIERACKGGEPDGCVALGRLQAESGDMLGPELETLFLKACDDGAPSGCVALGEIFETGELLTQDLIRAAGLYERACNEGAMRGCTHLGNLAYQGAGGLEQSVKRSVELNEEACRGGDRIGCARLGLLYAMGQGVDKDASRAAELYRSACTSKSSPFDDEPQQRRCATLRDMLAKPQGAKAPGEEAAEGDDTDGEGDTDDAVPTSDGAPAPEGDE